MRQRNGQRSEARRTASFRPILTLAAIVALIALLVPPPAARACSCDTPSLAELVARDPDVAAAVVRRIDRDGGSEGVGQVIRRLRGPLPDQVELQLDTGASCLPYVPVGGIAALSFRPDGDGWETVECGGLETASALTTAFGALQPDPTATGPPAVALAGAFPGGDLVTLDGELRVLAVADVAPDRVDRLIACEGSLVVTSFEEAGITIRRVSADDLAVLEERTLRDRWDIGLSCRPGGRVSAGGRHDSGEGGWVVPDVFGGADEVTLPRFTGIAFSDDTAFLLTTVEGSGSAIDTVDLDTFAQRRLTEVGFGVHAISVAPDGRHLTARGFDEEPVLLVLRAATGAVRSRSDGWWMPTGPEWLDASTLLLADEDGEYRGPAPELRAVDLDLRPVATFAGGPSVQDAAGRRLLRGGWVHEIAVVEPGTVVRQSPDLRLIGASSGVFLGEVTAGGDGPEPFVEVDPSVPTDEPAWPVIAAVALGAAAVAAAGALGWRRSRASG